MPLRIRLIALVAVALLISMALGGAVTLFTASRSVRTEMRSALLVGQQTVANVVREIGGSPNPQRELDDLIASFKGNRHLQVSLKSSAAPAQVQPVDERSPFGKMPKWFIRLIDVPPETLSIPVTIDGRPFANVVIETDPRNEIREVWNDLGGSLLALIAFVGCTIPLIYLFLGRALRPLKHLSGAMEQFGGGDYGIRIRERLSPELLRLRDSFNRMAAHLAATDADNCRLQEQLLNLQEEERNELARDLHDEIGPLLFAINVDVANMNRLLLEKRTAELPDHLQSASEAARHLQQQVRGMLSRLRPIGLAEFGLRAAVDGLVEFWRRRYPDIDYRLSIRPECEALGDRVDTTIYRVVQECLSNAVRHGNPRLIEISVERDERRGEIIVAVADDGAGIESKPEPGYGLIGMEERVKAMGGRLALANRPGGGLVVSASWPCGKPSLSVPVAEAAK